VAVLGYGNQGQAQALNLRDSGVAVLRRQPGRSLSRTGAGRWLCGLFDCGGCTCRDLLLVLTTDESQPLDLGRAGAAGGHSGQDAGLGEWLQCRFRSDCAATRRRCSMVAPRMIGVQVPRAVCPRQRGVGPGGGRRDATARPRERLLALCKGMGLTHGGVFRSTFREEAELDLFAEQVIWAGLEAWFLECFELGVAHGFSPELMVMELYASGETAQIFPISPKMAFFVRCCTIRRPGQYLGRSRAAPICSLWPCVTRPVRFCRGSTMAALSASGAASRRGGSGWKRCVLLPWLTRMQPGRGQCHRCGPGRSPGTG
jgi:ketol-acid reductoisomerase